MSVVVVEQYNPQWRLQFETVRSRLEAYLAGVKVLAIEHVGSTSVPGLPAKPILDIDIIVSRPDLQEAIDALVRKGSFTYLGDLGIVDRHAFRDPDQIPPRNVYVCIDGAIQTRNHLGVRDMLRKNEDLRDEYGKVKLELAAKGTNIVDYIEAKGPVIQKILAKAGLLSEEELAAIRNANVKEKRFGATKTERLLLREFAMTDVEAFYALESIPEVVRYQTWGPRSKEDALTEVARILRNSAVGNREHYELAVILPESDELIGRVGAKIERVTECGDQLESPHVDLWFSFLPEMQGKGFATEAVKKFIDLLKGREGKMELEIECDPRNVGSWKLAERLGFHKVSLTEKAFESKGEWVDTMVYRLTV